MPHLLLYNLHPHQPLLTSHHTSTSITATTTSFCKSCSILRQRSTAQIYGAKVVAPPPQQHSIMTTVKCMANPRRVKMVAKQIMRELSDMLLTDKVLQYAVLPEASLGADRYLSSLTTISDVEVSADLQISDKVAKARYSASADDGEIIGCFLVFQEIGLEPNIVVKVYVSVFGDERGKDVAISGLKSKAKYVRSELGRRMKLRLTPEIRFIEDESLERGSRVIAILDRIKTEKDGPESPNEEQSKASDVPQDDSDWEGDDPDEDIIYVK